MVAAATRFILQLARLSCKAGPLMLQGKNSLQGPRAALFPMSNLSPLPYAYVRPMRQVRFCKPLTVGVVLLVLIFKASKHALNHGKPLAGHLIRLTFL